MRILTFGILAGLGLAGCQSANSLAPAYATKIAGTAVAVQSLGPPGSDCGGADESYRHKGGKNGFPVLPGSGNFGGHLHYGSLDVRSANSELIGCPGSDNAYNVPIPSDYTPDWFGSYSFSVHPITFEGANLVADMYSTTWVPRRTYYMYVYDDQGTLLESYQMGPLSKKKSRLKFLSPFQNGFSVPSDGYMNLEIVHPSQ